MASRAKTKTTPRTRAAKAQGRLPPKPDPILAAIIGKPRSAAPLTEAKERMLMAIDVTRMLHEHQDAKLIGRRNRDMGFAILLVHLDAAYKALRRKTDQ